MRSQHPRYGRQHQPKAITHKAGKDVKMHMENFLAGSLAISEEEVDSFASYSTLT